MRNPRLRDTDGTEYDPETGQRGGAMLIVDEAGCVPDSALSVGGWKVGPFSFVGLHGDEPLLEVEALDVLTEKTGDA